jgi:hypothetical protein
MVHRTRMLAASLLASVLMLVAAPIATAQTTQNGLINVNVGDVTILEDVNIGVGAQVAAQICGVRVGPVVVLGTAVDRSGNSQTVCEIDQGDVTITQD